MTYSEIGFIFLSVSFLIQCFYLFYFSARVAYIKENKSVEILWLFSKSKSQFRFKGNAEFINDSKKYWNKLSEKSKEKWFWPHPGKKRDKFVFLL